MFGFGTWSPFQKKGDLEMTHGLIRSSFFVTMAVNLAAYMVA